MVALSSDALEKLKQNKEDLKEQETLEELLAMGPVKLEPSPPDRRVRR